MKTPIIKQSIYPDGTSIAIGEYIGRDDSIKVMEQMDSTDVITRRIESMKAAGYEFQHVRIVDATSVQ